MEDILDLYTRDYPPDEPLICMDESSRQLLGNVQPPLAMTPSHPLREDHHYKRCGTRDIFMFFDPMGGWRRATGSAQRRREDWAHQIKRLLDEDWPHAKKVTLVCDNLNTHHIGSLYHTFEASEACRLARRLEIHYTPRNGSWLNVAEIELSVLSRDYLSQRQSSVRTFDKGLVTWSSRRNGSATGVDWRFKTEDARIKLKHLYPTF